MKFEGDWVKSWPKVRLLRQLWKNIWKKVKKSVKIKQYFLISIVKV